jgi:hypothetical protein
MQNDISSCPDILDPARGKTILVIRVSLALFLIEAMKSHQNG